MNHLHSQGYFLISLGIYVRSCFCYVYKIWVKFFYWFLFILHDITIYIYWNVIIMKKPFQCKKRFDCITKLSIIHNSICQSFLKVDLFGFLSNELQMDMHQLCALILWFNFLLRLDLLLLFSQFIFICLVHMLASCSYDLFQ